jgi:hypothetical protein
VRAVVAGIADIIGKKSLEVSLLDRDHVIEQIMRATFDPTLRDAVPPRTFERGLQRFYLNRSNGAAGTSMRNRGADSKGNASRSCWAILWFAKIQNCSGIDDFTDVDDFVAAKAPNFSGIQQASTMFGPWLGPRRPVVQNHSPRLGSP